MVPTELLWIYITEGELGPIAPHPPELLQIYTRVSEMESAPLSPVGLFLLYTVGKGNPPPCHPWSYS